MGWNGQPFSKNQSSHIAIRLNISYVWELVLWIRLLGTPLIKYTMAYNWEVLLIKAVGICLVIINLERWLEQTGAIYWKSDFYIEFREEIEKIQDKVGHLRSESNSKLAIELADRILLSKFISKVSDFKISEAISRPFRE